MPHRPHEQQENGRAHERNHDFNQDAGRGMRATPKRMKDESAHDGPGQSDDRVPNESQPAAIDQLGRQHTGHQTDHDPRDYVMPGDRSESENHNIPLS